LPHEEKRFQQQLEVIIGGYSHVKKWIKALSVGLASVVVLGACGQGDGSENNAGSEGGGESSDFTAKMVTDVSGIDDKSFNQFSWEGLKAFGEANGLEEGKNYDYVQSSTAQDFEPNLRALTRENTDISWAIGFLMADAVKTVAQQNEDAQLAIIDSVVTDDNGDPLSNVANITFKEHEGSFLVGVAAGLQTETNKVGFIGGVESELIKKFENGFKAGVHAVNPDAEVIVQYAEVFTDPQKGQQLANTMYTTGADVIYHSAGNTGNGLFTEAINRVKNGEQVWAIGVDKDQYEEGVYEGDQSVTLTSMIKRVDTAVQDVTQQTMDGNFPGGEILEYGIEDDGIDYATTGDNLSPEIIESMDDYMQQILDGELEVPKTDDEFNEFAG
jgi:basic membrane protein A and related proteins